MSLNLTKFSISIGSTTILDAVDACLVEGDRVGLVGPNSCGKSTLLDALSHDDDENSDPYWTITSGKISGSFAQNKESTLLVKQDVLSWTHLFPGLDIDEDEIRTMTIQDILDLAYSLGLDYAYDDEHAWRKLYILSSKFLHWSLSDYESTAVGQLSPGSALRAYLAIALHRSDITLLLLDEPTNHLDLPSILWLQQSIIKSGKTFVIVSHDEEFLDKITSRIWEIDPVYSKLTASLAQYSAYMEAKRLDQEQKMKAYDEQQKRHKRLTAAAEKAKIESQRGAKFKGTDNDKLNRDFKRDRAGRTGKRAKAIETIRDSEEKIERIHQKIPLHIYLKPIAISNDSSILLDATLGYNESSSNSSIVKELHLSQLTYRFDYGERIAIIGFNSIGKSTLLKTITGEIDPLHGTVKIGRDLRIGNLMQEHESLPREISPQDYIASITGQKQIEAIKTAINYGLSRNQAESPINELNPGARARLLLASFSIRNVNTLILDEPTNHLDTEAIQELNSSLNTYSGMIIVVSHDRKFLNDLNLNKVICLDEQKGIIELTSTDSFLNDMEDIVTHIVNNSFQS